MDAPTASPPPSRWPTRVVVAGAVVAALLVVALAWVVPADGSPTALDAWVFEVTSTWTSQAPWAVSVAAAIGVATGVVPATALATATTITMLAKRRWALAVFVGLSAAVGALLVEVGKRTSGRLRPDGAEAYVVGSLDRSFPSGHAAAGIYVYVAAAVLLILVGRLHGSTAAEWAGRLLAVGGVVIGLSRIVLGVHWATDVLAGWAVGSAVLLVMAAATRPDDAMRPASVRLPTGRAPAG